MSRIVKLPTWENIALRLIAFYKLLHGLFFILVGVGLLHLRHHDVVQLLSTKFIVPWHLSPENQIVDWLLEKAGTLTAHKLLFLGWAAFFYAALFLAEGIGLYMRKHWAEYLVVIVTGSLLPYECYELYRQDHWWKLAPGVALIGNIAIVAYLVHRLMLDYHRRSGTQPKKSGRPPTSSTPSSKPAHTEARG